jgi:proteasome lid subunit RPN8/RPN11
MIIDLVNLKKVSPLAEGGEGIVYEWQDKILKVYKTNVNFSEKQGKIRLLISKKLSPNIIAPLEEVVDKNGRFIGFLMNKVEGEQFKSLSSKKFIKANGISNKDILNMLRQNCYAYFHGHSAGGTNPSLIEAMTTGCIIIAHNNEYNREVCDNFALYFKDTQELVHILELVENNYKNYSKLKDGVKKRALINYSWDRILNDYDNILK